MRTESSCDTGPIFYTLRVPIIEEDGSKLYKYMDWTEIWVVTTLGIRALMKYVEYEQGYRAFRRCMKELEPELPLAQEEIEDYWCQVFAETKKDKQVYLQIMSEAKVKMNPIVAAVFRPVEEEDTLAFAGLRKAIERIEEFAGYRILSDKKKDE